MRRIAVIACVLGIAACAPVQQKAPPVPEPAPQVQMPPRFDGLALLSQTLEPERDRIRDAFRYDRSIRMTDIERLRYYFYEPARQQRSVVGFAVLNSGSPTVNPVGLKKRGARREYAFLFPDRARENIYLTINDDVDLSGRFSHDNMFRELHFFPRRQLPALRVDHAGGRLEVTLPTGEMVRFDQDSGEVMDGVLKEAPIDFNRSRHQRRNPQVHYQGDYLAITVAQRGEAPRRARVWGQTKYAEVHYPARYRKSCRISPRHIWDQRPKPGDNDPKLTMLHAADEQLFTVIERECGWDLAAIRQPTPRLAGTVSDRGLR